MPIPEHQFYPNSQRLTWFSFEYRILNVRNHIVVDDRAQKLDAQSSLTLHCRNLLKADIKVKKAVSTFT